MAEQRLDSIEIKFENATQSASQVDDVADSLDGLAESQGAVTETAEQAAARQNQLAQRSVDLMGKIAGVTTVIQTMVAAFGSENETASLIGSMAGAASQGAALGLAWGPQGALVGAIVGAAIPALTSFVQGLEDNTDEMLEAGRAATTAAENYNSLAEAIENAARASRLNMGLGSASEYAGAIDSLNEERRNLLAERGSTTERVSEGRDREIRRRLSAISMEIAELQANSEVAAAEELDILEEDLADATRGNGGTRTPDSQERQGTGNDAADAVNALVVTQEASINLRYETLDLMDRELQLIRQTADAQNVATSEEHEQIDATIERLEKLEQTRANLMREQEENVADSLEVWGEFEGFVGFAIGGITKAFSLMAEGSATAEEAFLGLLKGFLEYISQWATLNALGEFAEAVKSAASYQWDAFALHLAAGAAFTGVAIATGIGAAAITPPSVSQAEPNDERESGGENQGTIVINYNSPIITAGTTAQLGRTMRQTMSTGDRRFGGRS
jgi:uncharacterized protein (UPF0335 family)